MKPQALRDMTDGELRARAAELVDELFHLRLRRASSQLPNPMKVRQARRDLARVKTILAERASGVRASSPAPPPGAGAAARVAGKGTDRTKPAADAVARPRRKRTRA
jgi:large subunit ribosomal protein L29